MAVDTSSTGYEAEHAVETLLSAAATTAATEAAPQQQAPAPSRLSPAERSNLLTRVTFHFAWPLLKEGANKPLQFSDLPPLPAHDNAGRVTAAVQHQWDIELRRNGVEGASLRNALYRAFAFEFWAAAFHAVSEASTCIIQPVLLRCMLRWIMHGCIDGTDNCTNSDIEGALLVVAFTCTSLWQAVTHHQLYLYTMRGGWNVRMACTGVIHSKLLRMGGTELVAVSSGNAINLISTDVMKFDSAFPNLHYIWAGPLECLAVIVLVWLQVGAVTTLAGTVVTLTVVLIQLRFSKVLLQVRTRTAKATDARVRAITEILAGIMTVKAFGWETPFAESVVKLRAVEAIHILRGQRIKGINLAIFFSAPALTSMITFAVFWALDNRMDVGTIYSVMALLNALRLALGKKFTRAMETAPEAMVAIERIREFLNTPELKYDLQNSTTPHDQHTQSPEALIVMDDASFRWQAAASEQKEDLQGAAVVSGLSLQLMPGEVLLVLGPVGCGKSTLLSALLGEVPQVGGKCSVTLDCVDGHAKSVGYAAQQPFIKAGTVRDNILFGHSVNESKLARLLDVCALEEDIASLPMGLETELGDKGVNLSGGQKARVALARVAVMSPALALLDDPLSAVDAAVANKLFRDCIRGELAQKTRSAVVLATHQQQFADEADLVLVLDENGHMCALGTAAELREQGQLAAIVPSDQAQVPAADAGDEDPPSMDVTKSDKEATEHRLVVDEDREVGVVSTATYMEYLRGGGMVTFTVVALLMCVGQAAMMGADVWLKIWSEASDQSQSYYMFVYCGLGMGTVLIGGVRALLFFTAALRGSSAMHDNAFRSIANAPMGFFSANPLGRIVNKFSSDQGQVDEMLPATFFDCVQIGSICLGSVVMVVVALPWMTLAMVPLALVFVRIRSFYVSSGRELKRLEGIGKSPVFALFHATLNGLVTIRAFGRQDATQDAFIEKLQEYGEAWYWWLMANRWVGFQLDMISTILLSLTVLLGVLLRNSVDAGLIGLAIMYSIQLSGTFQYCIRQSAQVENQMTSCERVMHYGRSVAPEESAKDRRSKQDPPPGWLESNGSSDTTNDVLQLDSVELRYREDLPLVLNNVSWSAPAGSKVGIVGRTGSGKSSTIMALMRLYAHGPGGTIRIGGADISKLPLSTLRDHVALIQQEPHLFAGTVRFNLDPWGRYSDTEIEEVLTAVQLKDAALGGEGSNSSVRGLAAEVSESGANLSVGQRQLLSLARAMLKRSPLILMDEATANVDFQTDSLIQTLMRDHKMFKDATVVVIAHRISTIIDSDLVIVMSDGHVVESGPPAELLKKPSGPFVTMVAASGGLSTELH